jgi:hypothetical protein
VGQGQKDALNDGSNVVSAQGTSSGSFDTAMVQAGAAAAQLNLQQGAVVEQAYVAKATGVVPKGKKEKCFRCNLHADHVGTECTAVLCVYCDSALHKDDDCHLLSLPKPTAVTYGLCNEELMWFEIPKSKDLRLKNTSGKVCRVRVTGSPMTIQEVVTEIESVIPGNNQLEIEAAGEGIFKLVLPSKADMARLRKIKDLELENSVIFFEEWSSKHVDKWGLYDLWVRVSGHSLQRLSCTFCSWISSWQGNGD